MTEHALTPTRESAGSAGRNLRSPYHTTVPAAGRIAPIKDLASSHHISIGAGVIDADFRGNLYVLLFNLSKYPYNISRGDKIAALICEKIYYSELVLVDTTWHGAKGFGSTGLN